MVLLHDLPTIHRCYNVKLSLTKWIRKSLSTFRLQKVINSDFIINFTCQGIDRFCRWRLSEAWSRLPEAWSRLSEAWSRLCGKLLPEYPDGKTRKTERKGKSNMKKHTRHIKTNYQKKKLRRKKKKEIRLSMSQNSVLNFT